MGNGELLKDSRQERSVIGLQVRSTTGDGMENEFKHSWEMFTIVQGGDCKEMK